jgi:hypothetical protein
MSAVLTHTWNDVARAIWPDASYVNGEGQFATVRGCGDRRTVCLHPTVEQARAAMRLMHPGGVGGPCMRKHVLLELSDRLRDE